MSFIVRCCYRDRCGSGWFALGKADDGTDCVTWGKSPNTTRYPTKELADAAAVEANAVDEANRIKNGGEGAQYKWEVIPL